MGAASPTTAAAGAPPPRRCDMPQRIARSGGNQRKLWSDNHLDPCKPSLLHNQLYKTRCKRFGVRFLGDMGNAVTCMPLLCAS